jgi:dinuclear metal center YbgI/SA1388 family protein
MLKAHPYEEVAYDVYPLENKGEVLGLGRIGTINEMTLAEFTEKVKSTLEVDKVRVVGDLTSKVKKVAVLGGDGNKYFMQAKFKGADVYVTGDVYYHTAHDAMMQGLNMIDPGHNVEKVMKKGLTEVLQKMSKETGYDVEIFPSEVNTNPFQFV